MPVRTEVGRVREVGWRVRYKSPLKVSQGDDGTISGVRSHPDDRRTTRPRSGRRVKRGRSET